MLAPFLFFRILARPCSARDKVNSLSSAHFVGHFFPTFRLPLSRTREARPFASKHFRPKARLIDKAKVSVIHKVIQKNCG